jgi:spore coat protein U-like protein
MRTLVKTLKFLRPGRLLAALALLWLLAAPGARADSCAASMSDVDFGPVSPIAGADYQASGTLTVTCTWTLLTGVPPLLLFPNVSVCVSLAGATDPRYLANGGQRLGFNLYTAANHAPGSVWGGVASPLGASTVNTAFGGLLALGSMSRSFTIHGRIPAAALSGVPTSGNGTTLYSASLGGTVHYAFYGLVSLPCTSGQSAAFGFQARAAVVNDCSIAAANLNFGAGSPLQGDLQASAPLTVRCSANTAYQVSLGGGQAGNPAARAMRHALTGETLSYRIAATPGGPVWGDGSAGTAPLSGVGNGASQTITLYGTVPRQQAPSPGDYRDTVVVRLVF